MLSYSIIGLKNRLISSKKQKMKIMEAEGLKNRRLMSKVMKGLLEIIYSVKVYSKRCEYLNKKHGSNLKNSVFRYWLERA